MKKCKIEGCKNTDIKLGFTKGMCHTHYCRWLKYGQLLAISPREMRKADLLRKIKPLHGEGLTNRVIALKLKVPRSTLTNYLFELGLKPNPGREIGKLIPCAYCQKETWYPPYRIKNNKYYFFCSPTHQSSYLKEHGINAEQLLNSRIAKGSKFISCGNCGEKKILPKRLAKKDYYCSKCIPLLFSKLVSFYTLLLALKIQNQKVHNPTMKLILGGKFPEIGLLRNVIYMYTDTITKKSYIGQTKRPLIKRLGQQITEARKTNLKYHFYEALRKYGPQNFEVKILAKCNHQEELDQNEIYFIAKYDTVKNGYNSTSGGESPEISDKTKIKQSLSRADYFKKGGTVWNEGKKKYKELNIGDNYDCACGCGGKIVLKYHHVHSRGKQKYIHGHNPVWNKGKKGLMPVSWNKGKKGLQVAWNKGLKGSIPWNKGLKGLKGRKHTEESKRKMREAYRGEKNPSAKLSDKQVTEIKSLYATGEYTQTDLALRFNISTSNISMIVNGKRRNN